MLFVQHVASAGAAMTDLGQSHGMRAVAARSGDQFMLFEVTPDGQAAVSGITVELTPAQLETIARGNITNLSVEHELPAFFVRSGPQFQVFYMTPDKERLIPGVMWDAAGKNVTRKQIADIPGAVPTVVVGGRAEIRQSGSTTDLIAALASCKRRSPARLAPHRPPSVLCSSTHGASIRSARCRCCSPMWRVAACRFGHSPIRAGSREPSSEHPECVGVVEQAS
jgi:hypothetical protein